MSDIFEDSFRPGNISTRPVPAATKAGNQPVESMRPVISAKVDPIEAAPESPDSVESESIRAPTPEEERRFSGRSATGSRAFAQPGRLRSMYSGSILFPGQGDEVPVHDAEVQVAEPGVFKGLGGFAGNTFSAPLPHAVPAPFLATTCTPVPCGSADWNRVDWFMTCVYRSSSISLRSVWQISHPGLLNQFKKRSRGSSSFLTLLSSDDLPGSVRQICEKGITESIKVRVGNQPLPGSHMENKKFRVRRVGAGRRLFEVVIARVAPGLSQISDKANIRDLPADFDSLLLRETEEPEDMVGEKFLAPQAFTHTYILRDGAQVLPLFVVRFEVDNEKEEELALPACESCERVAATIYCPSDDAVLCADCDAREHDPSNRIMCRHIRHPINEKNHHEIPCVLIPTENALWWDDDTGRAISDAAVKQRLAVNVDTLNSIDELYKSSVKIAKREDAFVAAIKQDLHEEIRQHSDKIKQVESEIKDANERAYGAVQAALTRVNALAEDRSKIILDSQRSLQKKLEFVQWSQVALLPFADKLPPKEWLHLWVNHYALVKKTIESADFQKGTDAADLGTADGLIVLRGALRVSS